ncbi:MAG: thiol:disulfide interchange protein DsbA/DsbL [Betaproteobacteria bacterium]|nr:thiol:disulfide interchange protein DsbA/DsbL [Betaproteobacteria bacterium]
MNPLRRSLITAIGLAPLAALAQRGSAPRAGEDYTVLGTPQPLDVGPGKIEVIEFFWYGCPHCYALEPSLEAWEAKLAPDVVFRPVPAIFSRDWAAYAQVFYAFEALGVRKRLHRPFFDAVHRDHLDIGNQAAMQQWLKRNGVDPQKFDQAVKSFGVLSEVNRAKQMTIGYRIDGVPTIAVQGRYTVSGEQSHVPDEARAFRIMLATTDYLIGLARKGLGKA